MYLTLCFPLISLSEIVLFLCDVLFSVGVQRVLYPLCYFVQFGCFRVLSAFIKQLRLHQVRSPAPDFPVTNTHLLQNRTHEPWWCWHHALPSEIACSTTCRFALLHSLGLIVGNEAVNTSVQPCNVTPQSMARKGVKIESNVYNTQTKTILTHLI